MADDDSTGTVALERATATKLTRGIVGIAVDAIERLVGMGATGRAEVKIQGSAAGAIGLGGSVGGDVPVPVAINIGGDGSVEKKSDGTYDLTFTAATPDVTETE